MGKSYLFKKRLNKRSSYKTILEAVRTLGYELKTDKRGVCIDWETASVYDQNKSIFHSINLTDERLPEWLNEQLEEQGLLKPEEEHYMDL